MEKCHCSRIPFSKIIEIVQAEGRDFREVADELGVGCTCTACKPDMIAFCEETLGLLQNAG